MTTPSPASLLELASAFQRSKILFALIDLGIPTLLSAGPRSRDEIAASIGANPLAADCYLSVCASLGLLIREGDAFRNAPETQRFLVKGTPAYLGDFIRRYERASHSTAWAELPQRLQSWRPVAGRLSYEGAPIGAEMEGQHRMSLLTGEALGQAIDLSDRRSLLDLGGGTGAMSIALCGRHPALHAVILEQPEMVPVASAYVRESGLEDRIRVQEGDFISDPLPRECDVALLANILSLGSIETNRALLKHIFESLPPGGIVVLSGWMLDDDGSGPLLPVMFSLEDILLGAPDVERSAANYGEWLAEAGFERIEQGTYFEPVCFVLGRKP